MLFVQVAAELEVLALAEMVEEEERQVKDKKREEVETHIIDMVMEKEAYNVLVMGVRLQICYWEGVSQAQDQEASGREDLPLQHL